VEHIIYFVDYSVSHVKDFSVNKNNAFKEASKTGFVSVKGVTARTKCRVIRFVDCTIRRY
jgi:hypothetical protein